MRRFLLVAHDARTDGDFPLDDMPGRGGRLDLVARCVVASLLVSHGVRRDAEFAAVLLGPPRPPRTVRFVGAEIKGLNPDERSTGALLRKALAVEGLAERTVHSGVLVAGQGLEDLLAEDAPVFVLDESGLDLRTVDVGPDATFIISDHRDLTEPERDVLNARGAQRVSVGPRSLQADQVITVVHNELDRR